MDLDRAVRRCALSDESTDLAEEVDHPLAIYPIFTGSLTTEGEGSDYLSFIRYNMNQIAKGLAGN